MIFYDRIALSINKGLTEIKDQIFVSGLKKEFNRNYKHFGDVAPIICGTVVDRNPN